MSLPPWIRSIKRPLEGLVAVRRSFEDLPDTEPGDDSLDAPGHIVGLPLRPAPVHVGFGLTDDDTTLDDDPTD